MATLKTILVTGSGGFLGKNLIQTLSTRDDIRVIEHEVDDSRDDLDKALRVADVVVHLAGVNRPKSTDEYITGNTQSQNQCVTRFVLQETRRSLCLQSSRAKQPYGVSKRLAEEQLKKFAMSQCKVVVFRFKNILVNGPTQL